MYICGVSRAFYVVWRIVRPWIDARTASKITFLTTDDIPELLNFIAPSEARDERNALLLSSFSMLSASSCRCLNCDGCSHCSRWRVVDVRP